MTTLKQGDLIKGGKGGIHKILGVCGEVVHLSYSGVGLDSYLSSYTEVQLKKQGYTWDTPVWEPERKEIYWFIANESECFQSYWDNDKTDHDRRDFLGVYPTKELAAAALLEIRRKLGK